MENVPIMPATTAALTASTTPLRVQTPNSFEIIQILLGRLDLFASVFGVIFTMIIFFLGYLTWISNRQKDEASKQLKQIENMGNEASNLYKSLNEITSESKKLLNEANQQMQKAREIVNEAEVTLAGVKRKDTELGDLQKKMNNLRNEMDRTIPVISNASVSLPYIQGFSPISGLNTGQENLLNIQPMPQSSIRLNDVPRNETETRVNI